MRTQIHTRAWPCVAVLFLAGCGETLQAPEPVAMDKVPESVLQVAVKEMPNVKFEHAWKITVDGKEAYEIKGKDRRGKTCEVEVSTTGEVLEVE